jgi:SAM-dependent methyltransferase
LTFRAHLPTASDLASIYDDAYFAGTTRDGYLDYVGDADVHRLNARKRLARLNCLTTRGCLLDVGCAAGFFVDEAQRDGWSAVGVDVSHPMVAWGQSHTEARLSVGTLIDFPRDGTPLSCITMWDYLEHTLDPRADVEDAFSRLSPGGIIALSTGDVGSLLARLSLRRWHLMTPRHHNYFFSARTLTTLLRSCGFELVQLSRPAAVYPLRYLAHKACLVLNVGLLDAVAERIAASTVGTIRVPVNLWDVITVVARRPHN